MLFRKKQPEIMVLMTCGTLSEAQLVQSGLAEAGIRCALREPGADDHLKIISAKSHQIGVQVLVNTEDAETAMEVLSHAGFFQESEELTDEELEELALSMAEITGLEDEEN